MKNFAQISLFQRRTQRPFTLQRAYVTWAIVISNVLWFVGVEGSRGFSESGLIASGALYPAAPWYEYISAMFVHLGFFHIGLNMISLISLYLVEFLLGSAGYAALYLLSGVAGNLVFNFFTPGISAGASGAIFGVFGAALALSFMHILPKSVRNQLLVLLVLNLAYDFTHPGIGTLAHIGGLGAGITLGALFYRAGRTRLWLKMLAGFCVLVSGLALFQVLLS